MKTPSAFYIFLASVLLLSSPGHAQENTSPRLQAGMTGNLSFNLVQAGDAFFKPTGFNHDLSVGMIFNTRFKNSPNLGISTGFEFEFTKLNYTLQDSVFYRYAGSNLLQKDELGGTKYLLTDREYSSVGIAIPLMMLFRMQPIGDWTIFGKFGLRNSFLVSQKINDRGYDMGMDASNNTTWTAKDNGNLKGLGESFFYRGSVGFSAGAQWNFAGSTSLVPEIGFYYGLTPLHWRLVENNYTLTSSLATPDAAYFYPRARQNQIILKISLLF
ncbi:MAG: hypothetical protein EB023_14090 [Flavobacteriia bacterium]|nr:hypothetical protein [Flavobacteriia bacterium]